MKARSRRFPGIRADVASGVAVLAAWQIVAVTVRPQWLPELPAVLTQVWALVTSGALSVLGTTAVTLLLGLLVTFVLAGAAAGLMAAGDVAERSLMPYVTGFLSVPHIALVPLFTFLWGNGELTRVVTTVAFAVSPVALTWTSALKQSPRELVEMAASFGAGPSAVARHVRLPAAAAPLVAGVRIGVVQGIKGTVSAEILIGIVGVGKLVTTASQTFDIARLYAIVLVIIALSIVFYLLLNFVEDRMTRWTS
ncbi:ABC transporter permease subunit [Amycolatopsis rubida]|uniref:ABC transporter permease subunit n=1 Tax=Amycolatopsis rubida TaxID=112413 RepID=A0A1I5V5Y3_9PSEU|nr:MULTISPECIES: ABC transporter permease subunit [Amycolatopsis]MYW93550.1 ABC transporter permease subunit [Amycolatopsis rubida]NEC58537.1 ABC transporter permease subunit [Amycolatopsis rubida]OAP21194.1 putative aliphatic sulfonates transport permease protein SsuC [Amycolatopsis sp. M39]SFQ02757.1 NitT/TauT family transport system permease protein/osmoprotectant transport system permease protein [Amycolatopsis rubida]